MYNDPYTWRMGVLASELEVNVSRPPFHPPVVFSNSVDRLAPPANEASSTDAAPTQTDLSDSPQPPIALSANPCILTFRSLEN